jgi:outer membrane protein
MSVKFNRSHMRRTYSLILMAVMSVASAFAQELLTADDAVGIALKNNYDILMATNNAEISRLNNTPGNAGMLPELAVNSSGNYSRNNVDQKFSSGETNSYSNSGANSFNAGVELNWTLFDGGRMFITKNKLTEIQTLGEIEFRDQVLQTVFNVLVAYYEVVREKQQLVSINEVINKNEAIVNILKTSFGAGLTPKTNLLQAQIDLNVFRESAINQVTAIVAAKRILNQLLSRDANFQFEVVDTIPFDKMPDKDELTKKLFESNTSVLMGRKQLEIANLGLKEYKTALLPNLHFNAGYNFLKSENSYGSLQMNQIYGPQIGATLSIPIYQAGNASRQVRTARLQVQSSEYNLESTRLEVNSELQNTLTIYEGQMQLQEIEKSNTELARENLDISIERLRLGQTTTLELHQAQESYVDSQTRLINFEYYLKIAETRLKKLMAGL